MGHTFDDLDFHPCLSPFLWPTHLYEKATIFFPNGYGVSVIHRVPDSRYEVAVLVGNKYKWKIRFDAEIPFNVLSYMSPDEVTVRLQQVEALPKKEEGNNES